MGGSALSWKLFGGFLCCSITLLQCGTCRSAWTWESPTQTSPYSPPGVSCVTGRTGDGMLQCSQQCFGVQGRPWRIPVEVPHGVRPSTMLLHTGLSVAAPRAPYRRAAGSAEKPPGQQPGLCSLLFPSAQGSCWQGVGAPHWWCEAAWLRDPGESIFLGFLLV